MGADDVALVGGPADGDHFPRDQVSHPYGVMCEVGDHPGHANLLVDGMVCRYTWDGPDTLRFIGSISLDEYRKGD
jgi:hypothetical protein